MKECTRLRIRITMVLLALTYMDIHLRITVILSMSMEVHPHLDQLSSCHIRLCLHLLMGMVTWVNIHPTHSTHRHRLLRMGMVDMEGRGIEKLRWLKWGIHIDIWRRKVVKARKGGMSMEMGIHSKKGSIDVKGRIENATGKVKEKEKEMRYKEDSRWYENGNEKEKENDKFSEEMTVIALSARRSLHPTIVRAAK